MEKNGGGNLLARPTELELPTNREAEDHCTGTLVLRTPQSTQPPTGIPWRLHVIPAKPCALPGGRVSHSDQNLFLSTAGRRKTRSDARSKAEYRENTRTKREDEPWYCGLLARCLPGAMELLRVLTGTTSCHAPRTLIAENCMPHNAPGGLVSRVPRRRIMPCPPLSSLESSELESRVIRHIHEG